MDGLRIDDVSRALARGASRRAVIKGLVAGIAAAVGVRSLPPEAAAAATCTSPGPLNYCNSDADCCGASLCRGGVCTCPAGQKICQGGCIASTATCGPTQCPAGFRSCGGICKDVSRDVNNCGACGRVCGPAKTCSNGQCCPKGTVFCNGSCKMASQCELLV